MMMMLLTLMLLGRLQLLGLLGLLQLLLALVVNPFSVSVEQEDEFVHVYRCAFRFMEGVEHLFICDCEGMETARCLLGGMDTSTISSDECRTHLNFCRHSKALSADPNRASVTEGVLL